MTAELHFRISQGQASPGDAATTEFIVQEDGLLTEKAAHEAVQGLASMDLDPATHEAHMMLVKAYTSLTAAARRNNPSSQSLGRYNVLRVLHGAEGRRLLMSEIGDRLETSPTVVTRLVDALVADRLVRRIDHPDDKRKTWAEITDAGFELYEHESPLMLLEVQKLWTGVTPEEKRLLVHLLTKVRLSVRAASLQYPELPAQ
jgi:MarR family 2-MHQ and catechol resistance regulon transcriptional repressor